MKSFRSIVTPHKDILAGKLTQDIFAADLWEVMKDRGPSEYRDVETFFNKTYLTEGLKSLIEIVRKRTHGEGGDPVIQIQTPFGGGKTHTLISMYHKAREWGIKTVVIVGEKLKTGSKSDDFDTLWGIIEQQLTGSVEEFSSHIPPGGEQVKTFLEKHSPILFLIDELIPYLNIADAVSVGKSDITTLTLTFLGTLINVVSELENVALAFTTTPSNPYNRTTRGEEILMQLSNITGRRKIIKSPIQDEEIAKIIRKRLFSYTDESLLKKAVEEFVKYAENEGILPQEFQQSEYRDKFLDSYPFLPEVIDVLYHRWGSYPMFQRTRGVLKLLSTVIYDLMDKNMPYITLADFNLANQDIRQAFLDHIGEEYNGIIDVDITGVSSNAKRVDSSLASSYRGLNLGPRVATAIFLYSFSGGHEYGITKNEIKLSTASVGNPSNVITDVIQGLAGESGSLFYIHSSGERYFFSNRPNIRKILYIYKENIKDEELVNLEYDLLKLKLSGDKFSTYVWEDKSENIPDSVELKLVILPHKNQEIIHNLLERKGQTPRVYRNTMIFLYPIEGEKSNFLDTVKSKIAYQSIEKDKNLNLSEEQIKEIRTAIKNNESKIIEMICRLYRGVSIPQKDNLKEFTLGVPMFGEDVQLDQKVYEELRSSDDIVERISPVVFEKKYLSEKEYASIEQIYQSFLTTPGEVRPINRTVFENGIIEGIRMGYFGVGALENDMPMCRYYKENMCDSFLGDEIIINKEICQKQKEKKEEDSYTEGGQFDREYKTKEEENSSKKDTLSTTEQLEVKKKVSLKFKIPKGRVSDIMGIMHLLQSKFNDLQIEINAEDGEITEQDYENKIEETFHQLGIEYDEKD